eukprot:992832-Lingulodinium_polyedra.AAC.1
MRLFFGPWPSPGSLFPEVEVQQQRSAKALARRRLNTKTASVAFDVALEAEAVARLQGAAVLSDP